MRVLTAEIERKIRVEERQRILNRLSQHANHMGEMNSLLWIEVEKIVMLDGIDPHHKNRAEAPR